MLKKNEFWSRVFTFVPTATKADGEEIDEAAFRKAIDYQIENGVDGVCIFGSTGGNGSFTDDEMKKATAIAAKHIDGRISLVAGSGARTTNSLHLAVETRRGRWLRRRHGAAGIILAADNRRGVRSLRACLEVNQHSDLRLQQSVDDRRRHEAGISRQDRAVAEL